jgi:hypothetical protein
MEKALGEVIPVLMTARAVFQQDQLGLLSPSHLLMVVK